MSEGMMENNRNMHYEWLQKSIADLEDKRRTFKGLGSYKNEFIEIHIGELQRILHELLSMHIRCDRLEEMLAQGSNYFCPKPVFIREENSGLTPGV